MATRRRTGRSTKRELLARARLILALDAPDPARAQSAGFDAADDGRAPVPPQRTPCAATSVDRNEGAFESAEVYAEAYMATVRCGERHHPVHAGASAAGCRNDTRADSGRLGGNLRLGPERGSAPGQVPFPGNTLALGRVATR